MPLHNPIIWNTVFQNSEITSILIFDPSGIIMDVNPGFQKSFGYSREKLIGKNFSMLFVEEDIKKNIPVKILEKTIQAGSSKNHHYILHEDGIPVWVTGENIFANADGSQYIVKIVQNMNDQKVLEQKLKEINEEQQEIIKDNENFIYTTSHDLKSPISNLEGLINELGKVQDLPEEAGVYFPMFHITLDRLNSKILEIAALGEKQRTEIVKKPTVKFQKVFNEVLLDLEQEIKSADAEILVDFSLAPTLRYVKKNLKSILQNLLINSLKYRSDVRKLKVKVRTEQVGDYIQLTFTDNGLGISEEEKERIFEMYHRAHTHIEGTGVGLALIKKMIEDAGGTIGYDSRVGEGTQFNIYFKVSSS